MKKTLMSLAGLAVASLAAAQLTKFQDWPKSPEAYFLTPAERQEWANVRNDEDAERFIATYWAKRDPSPATPQNEFRDQVSRRIAAADEQFKMRRQKGSESARGRLLIVLGPPTRVTQTRAREGDLSSQSDVGAVRPEGFPTGPGLPESGASTTTTWIYEKSRFDASANLGELRAAILVDPSRGADQLQNAGPVEKAVSWAAGASMVNPSGEVGRAASSAPPAMKPVVPPAATGPAPAAPGPAGSAAPAPASVALPATIRSFLEALAKEKKEDASSAFWAGPFRSIAGEPFYALQLSLPVEKTPAAGVKFGGVVMSESGQEAASYWEDAALLDMKTGTKTDKMFERSVVLPPGNYRGAFGLFPAAPDGGPALVSASAAFVLEAKPGEFQVSPLILANNLIPLTKRPGATDPFVFGMEKPIRVDPKGDRLFTQQDGLWYFFTISNPKLPDAPASAPGPAPSPAPAPAGTPAPGAPTAAPAVAEEPRPRIMTTISVLKDGKPAFAPATSPADLQPLGPGYYASGSEIPLTSFEPGYYTFSVKVRDLNAGKDSSAYKGMDRKEDFVVLKADGSLPEKPKPAAAAPKTKPAKKG